MKANGSFEGFETWSNSFKLGFKMHRSVLLVLSALIIAIFLFSVSVTYKYQTYVTTRWLIAKTIGSVLPTVTLSFRNSNGAMVRVRSATILTSQWVQDVVDGELKRLWLILLAISLPTYLLCYPLAVILFKRRSNTQSRVQYLRGARFISEKAYHKQLIEQKQKASIPIATVKMPVNNETRGTFIIGKPGKGKTVCLDAVLENLKKQKAKAVVYDYKGDYVSKFYDPDEDLIFNPLDTRSVGWTLLNEVKTDMDVDAIASSLVPPSISNTDPFWPDSARAVFSGCLHYLYRQDIRTNEELWLMLTADANDLAEKFKHLKGGEAGHRYIDMNDKTSKQADSVLSVTMQYTKCFEYMGACEGSFSVDEWLKDEKGGVIFVTNYEIIQDTLRPILSLFIDLLCRRFLSMEDSYNRRIFFLLDEIGTLQRLTSIVKFLTNIRSKGGAPFVGVQDYGQLDKIYSREVAHTIVNALNNSITFAVSDQSAKRAAENIGQFEYIETEKSYNIGVSDIRDGVSINQRRKKDLLVLPSEIQNLPDLNGIVKFENYDFMKASFEYKARPKVNPQFILRPELTMEKIVEEERDILKNIDDIKVEIKEIEDVQEPPAYADDPYDWSADDIINSEDTSVKEA